MLASSPGSRRRHQDACCWDPIRAHRRRRQNSPTWRGPAPGMDRRSALRTTPVERTPALRISAIRSSAPSRSAIPWPARPRRHPSTLRPPTPRGTEPRRSEHASGTRSPTTSCHLAKTGASNRTEAVTSMHQHGANDTSCAATPRCVRSRTLPWRTCAGRPDT